MITVRETVQTPLAPEAAFDYLSNFEHTSEWDPGTPVVEKLTAGPVAVGSRYRAEADFRGKRQVIEYVVTDLAPAEITLRGENSTVISVDTITVAPAPGGSAVTYNAEFTLKGILKLGEPFMHKMFQGLAGPAIAGLQTKLDSLAG